MEKRQRLHEKSYSSTHTMNGYTYSFISSGSMLMRKEREYNDHHRCPRSKFGATNDLNVETIRKTVHNAIHTVFANDIFPEQIERLTNMTSRVLLPEIQQELLERLSARDIHDPTQRYKEGALYLPKKYK